jgi:hypothetical protein
LLVEGEGGVGRLTEGFVGVSTGERQDSHGQS